MGDKCSGSTRASNPLGVSSILTSPAKFPLEEETLVDSNDRNISMAILEEQRVYRNQIING